jgi:hypothetical protein
MDAVRFRRGSCVGRQGSEDIVLWVVFVRSWGSLYLVVDTELDCGPDRKTVSGRGRVAAASYSCVWVRVNSDAQLKAGGKVGSPDLL